MESKPLKWLAIAIAICALAPLALADTAPFTVTGGSTSTVNLTFNNPEFSMKIQDGPDFSFNCSGCSLTDKTTYDTSISGTALFGSFLDLTVGGTTYFSYFTTTIDATTNPGGLGPFAFSLSQITPELFCTTLGTICSGTSYTQSVTSVDSLHLALASGTFGTDFAVHICDSGTPGTPSSPTCSGTTYFETNGGVIGTPEPASLMLLAAGLLGVAGVGRRKFVRKHEE